MEFQPLHKTRLFESIVRQIRQQIQEGKLKPGDQLPSERDLSERFKVSRASVREALRTLEIMGYVEIKAGEGVFVKAVKLDDLLEPITTSIYVDKTLILNLLDLRDVMEMETARKAAIYGEERDLQKIEAVLLAGEEEIKTGAIGLNSDNQFHHAIAEATHNNIYVLVMNLISDLLDKSREATLKIPGQPKRTLEDHWKIYHAIRNRQPEEAAQLMKEHINKAKKNITRLVSEGNLPQGTKVKKKIM